ncbi:hypothetical protein WJX82_006585 [Trebouxia sp. C0006]
MVFSWDTPAHCRYTSQRQTPVCQSFGGGPPYGLEIPCNTCRHGTMAAQARLWEASQVLSCRAKGRTRSWLVVTKAEAGVRL